MLANSCSFSWIFCVSRMSSSLRNSIFANSSFISTACFLREFFSAASVMLLRVMRSFMFFEGLACFSGERWWQKSTFFILGSSFLARCRYLNSQQEGSPRTGASARAYFCSISSMSFLSLRQPASLSRWSARQRASSSLSLRISSASLNMRSLSLASVLRWVDGWLSSQGMFLSLFLSWSISPVSPRMSSSFCLISSSSATSYSFYDRSTFLSFSLFPHYLSTSTACAISFLICSSMPRLPMELSVLSLALPFLNSRSSESLEECSLERESWVRLCPIVLILSPMWLPLLLGLRDYRSARFWLFYSIINSTLNISQTAPGRGDATNQKLGDGVVGQGGQGMIIDNRV